MKASSNPSSIRSKKEITDAMIRLMQQHLFSEITVKQIVLEAKLERKTFYNNFSSKDDVLDSVINSAIYEYVQVLTTSADGPLSVIFNFCDKNRELLQLLHKNNLLYLLLLKLNVVIPFNIGAIWNVIFKWVDRGMKDSPDYIRATLEEYLKKI